MGVVYSKIACAATLRVYTASSSWPEACVPSVLRVDVAWIVVTALLFPARLWFSRVNETRRDWWLRYL